MNGKKRAGNDTVRTDTIFDDFLKLPGARKAHRGAILETPEGTFHLLGFAENDKSLPHEAQFYLPFCTPKEAKRVLEISNSADYLLKKQADAIADQPRQLRRILAAKDEWLERGRSWSLGSYYNGLGSVAQNG